MGWDGLGWQHQLHHDTIIKYKLGVFELWAIKVAFNKCNCSARDARHGE